MAPKMAFFTGFGPRRAAGLAEQPKFLFAIVIWHLNEHSVRVSALNSKIFLISTPLHVVEKVGKIENQHSVLWISARSPLFLWKLS